MNSHHTCVIADGHVHVYPAYDTGKLFRNLIHNLDRLAEEANPAGSRTTANEIYKLAFLVESRENDFFGRLENQDRTIAGHGLKVISAPDPVCATVAVRGAGEVCLVAGRQIVTSERLEILALAMRAALPDGLPAGEVVRRVVDAGGIPVLAWSPGKWLFGRGQLARDLIASDRRLCLGDTTLRPALWPEPRLMQLARARGLAVIPGSDPLPFAGEERYAGTYGFIYRGAFDPVHPAVSIGRMLADPAAIMPAGARCGALTVARRLMRLRKARI